jgi:hypothetical protein
MGPTYCILLYLLGREAYSISQADKGQQTSVCELLKTVGLVLALVETWLVADMFAGSLAHTVATGVIAFALVTIGTALYGEKIGTWAIRLLTEPRILKS